ncbi:MAG: aminopeptidase P family protein [Clostridia bacterium]|nr:aminopeptidase P family protein [Clostridia bacterium]
MEARKGEDEMTAAERLMDQFRLGSAAAAVIHDPSNMFYLTEGYTGEGLVFISQARRVIVTDFRYTEQAERQAPGFEVIMTEKGRGADQVLAELAKEGKISELRAETNYLSVDAYEKMRAALGEEISCVPLDGAPQKLRQVKTPAEVMIIRKACDITSEAFRAILPKIREGMTEKELQIELDFTMLRLGADRLAFDTIVASGENGSLPHAIPGPRTIQRGDMITLDFGAKVGNYCADMTRTVAFGQPSDEMRRIYDTVLRAQTMCEDALAAGKKCFDIDKLARDYIDARGYAGRFGHGLGHSVGIDIHEEPRLSPVCQEILKAGVVITVEPGVYVPGVGGVRIENTCLVKENGCDPLTTADKQLIIL